MSLPAHKRIYGCQILCTTVSTCYKSNFPNYNYFIYNYRYKYTKHFSAREDQFYTCTLIFFLKKLQFSLPDDGNEVANVTKRLIRRLIVSIIKSPISSQAHFRENRLRTCILPSTENRNEFRMAADKFRTLHYGVIVFARHLTREAKPSACRKIEPSRWQHGDADGGSCVIGT